MVKHPGVGRNTGVKPVNNLQQSVGPGLPKRIEMLMVVIPATDAHFGRQAEQHPEHNKDTVFTE